MADKDKAPAAASGSETRIDFSTLPSTALDTYIATYDLAKGYPPPPSKRSPSPDGDEDGDGGVDDDGNRRSSSKNIEEGNTVTTATRLRPRSPTSSVAHLFPTSARRGGALVNGAAGAAGEGAGTSGINGTGTGSDETDGPSHFFDAGEADAYLAGLAEKHFASQPQPKEGEVVVQFLYRCRAGDKVLRVAS